MKILSIKQPYAWLVVNGHKSVENRTWYTRHRGPLLIHAGTHLAKDVAGIRRLCLGRGITLPAEFERGGIVGQVNLREIVLQHPSPWFEGPYAWILSDPKPLKFFPMRGRLGLFWLDDELLGKLNPQKPLF